ncbi:MAG TPA: leucyl aminopeptidase [Solirubrobacterales bacterium]|nr:leucyl aminopeptidase [Solirubrobacterales bacterium]
MRVEFSPHPWPEADADLVAVGLVKGADLAAELRDAPGSADARAELDRLTLAYPGRPARVAVAGLGEPGDADAERLRVVAAAVAKRAAALEARTLAWVLPDLPGVVAADAAAALVEGTILAGYRFDRYRGRDEGEPEPVALERLTLLAPAGPGVENEVEAARVAAAAANRARELQDTPANDLSPADLARRAEEIAAEHDPLSVDVLGPEQIAARGLGGLAAVAAGSAVEPRLIVLRHAAGGSGGGGETIGLVGKAVTFDSGGISIKPSTGMHEMKMDMSGGAAVLEAVGAIAELGLGLDLVAVVPATENMPSGTATRPGDVITQLNGMTVEVTNTDAEGRLILADALTYCVRELGADRVVDLATLTGAVIVALGSTYAALVSNDDAWAERVFEAAEDSGELAWRLPLHDEYRELTKGKVADLVNSAAKRKAGTIYGAAFLEHFVDSKPWAHLDIAGTSWDVGREYVGSGPTGFGVRLLVRLARGLAGDG